MAIDPQRKKLVEDWLQQTKKLVEDWLQQKKVKKECPACGNAGSSVKELVRLHGAEEFEAVALICDNCANVRLFKVVFDERGH
jgi:hypothetical protein